MSEVADNATPAEEVAEKVAPVVEEAVVEEKAQSENKLEKFGQILEYAPDELKSAKTWEKFKDVDIPTALKAIVDMDKWTGKKGDLPNKNSTPEEIQEFYTKFGVPKEAKEYEFTVHENIDLDEPTKTALKEVAHKRNLNKEQALVVDDMLSIYGGIKKQEQEAKMQQREAAQKMIDEAWGESFDEMSNAIRGIEKHYDFSPEATAIIENNPHLLIEFGKIAKDLDEKGQAGNAFSQTRIGVTAQREDLDRQIQARLIENKGNVRDPIVVSLGEQRSRLMRKEESFKK